MTRTASRVRAAKEALLTAGAILGTLSILAALASALLGITPLVFRSGSMSPAIDTGDLGIARSVSVSDIAPGDVVSVDNGRGVRVTHRVVSVEVTGNSARLVLQGDANDDADPQPYVVTSADRLLFSIPRGGYVVTAMSGPLGIFVGGLAAGMLVLLIFGSRTRTGEPGDRDGTPPGRHAAPLTTTAVVAGALLVVGGTLPGLTLSARTHSTLAAWTDSVAATGVSATAYTVPVPTITSCANTPAGSTSLRHVTLTWNHTASPLNDYTVSVDVDPAPNVTISGSGATRSVDIAYNPGSVTYKNKLVTASVTPKLSATTSWTGPADTWKFLTPNNNNQATCAEKVAPTVGFTAPDTTTRTSAAEITYIGGASGCANASRPACGTMADVSTISTVTYLFERVTAGVTMCWNGTTWAADCTTWQAGTIFSQTVWRVPGTNSLVYATPGGAFTLTVRATDSWGNVGSATRSFTVTP